MRYVKFILGGTDGSQIRRTAAKRTAMDGLKLQNLARAIAASWLISGSFSIVVIRRLLCTHRSGLDTLPWPVMRNKSRFGGFDDRPCALGYTASKRDRPAEECVHSKPTARNWDACVSLEMRLADSNRAGFWAIESTIYAGQTTESNQQSMQQRGEQLSWITNTWIAFVTSRVASPELTGRWVAKYNAHRWVRLPRFGGVQWNSEHVSEMTGILQVTLWAEGDVEIRFHVLAGLTTSSDLVDIWILN